ncbi:PilC/PilY family type IV pilus protein [Persephonella sp.]
MGNLIQRKLLTGYLMLFLLLTFSNNPTNASGYCSVPPFISSSASPNILFVIDVSGSMSWSAYNPNDNGYSFCTDEDNGCGWTYTGDEEGYFIPNENYVLIGDCEFWNYHECYWEETDKDAVNECPNVWSGVFDDEKVFKGSCLNFLLMARIDLLRWAITGGVPEGCGSLMDPNCDPDIKCTGSTCMLETYYGFRVKVPKKRINGILQIFEKEDLKPRFGALFYGGSVREEKVYVGDYPYTGSAGNAVKDKPYTYIKRFINAIDVYGGTPTGPAMWEAYDYFKQKNDHNYKGFKLGKGTYKDPNYFCDHKRQNCKAVPCAKNFVILASDGQWNSPSCSIKRGFENKSADPVVPAYKMHAETLRTITSHSGNTYNINVSGVYALGLFLGGTGEQSLKNVAVYGSFDTDTYTWPFGTDGSHWNGANSKYPWDKCYMDNCGNGRGSACTPLPPSSSDWDFNNDGVPDNFLNAKNASEIKESLEKFIRNILKKGSTSAGVIASQSAGRAQGSIINHTSTYPLKNVSIRKNNRFEKVTLNWIGKLYTYWFLNTQYAQNVRDNSKEDTSRILLDVYNPEYDKKKNAGQLITENDYYDFILLFDTDSEGNLQAYLYESELKGELRYDNAGDPVVADYTPTPPIPIEKTNYLWEAGEILAHTDGDERDILVAVSNKTMVKFDEDNKNQFASFLGNPSSFPSCIPGSTNEKKIENLIAYIRGEDDFQCRNRTLFLGDSNVIWKLGDIMHSSPAIVTYNSSKYKGSIVFVGANDGMLHAFEAGKIERLTAKFQVAELKTNKTEKGLGAELWAFIPKNVLPYLRYLPDPDYCHMYFVDQSPYVVYLDKNKDGSPDKIILIGGMRLGGGCGCEGYDCINPPSDTCSDLESNNCVGRSSYFALDITDPTDPKLLWEFTHPKLGFSFSGPGIFKFLDGDQEKAHVLFASGPTNYKGLSAQNLHLFVLDVETGNNVATVKTNLSKAFGGIIQQEGLDINQDGNTDFVIFGFTQEKDTDKIVGGVIVVPRAGYANYHVLNIDSGDIPPVVSQVAYSTCYNVPYIYFGTGKWFYKEDTITVSGRNRIYGIPIGCDNERCEVPSNIYDITDLSSGVCNSLSGERVGWYIKLARSDSVYLEEKNLASPSVTDFGAVFFATSQPSSDICDIGGRHRIWHLNCATGAPITYNCNDEYFVKSEYTLLYSDTGGRINQESKPKDASDVSGGNTGWKKHLVVGGQSPQTAFTPGGEILLWLER